MERGREGGMKGGREGRQMRVGIHSRKDFLQRVLFHSSGLKNSLRSRNNSEDDTLRKTLTSLLQLFLLNLPPLLGQELLPFHAILHTVQDLTGWRKNGVKAHA